LLFINQIPILAVYIRVHVLWDSHTISVHGYMTCDKLVTKNDSWWSYKLFFCVSTMDIWHVNRGNTLLIINQILFWQYILESMSCGTARQMVMLMRGW